MQDFTQDVFSPSAATILFIKQYARTCNNLKKNNKDGYNHFSVIASC